MHVCIDDGDAQVSLGGTCLILGFDFEGRIVGLDSEASVQMGKTERMKCLNVPSNIAEEIAAAVLYRLAGRSLHL